MKSNELSILVAETALACFRISFISAKTSSWTMATCTDLHNQISAAKVRLEEKKIYTEILRDESARAEERQKLRRQLEEVQKQISNQEPCHVWTQNSSERKKENNGVENCSVYLSHSLLVFSFLRD